MKTISAELAYFLRGRARQNLKLLLYYSVFLLLMILVYASVFRYLMFHLEGREFSFIAGVYWAITVMTTLALVTSLFIPISVMPSPPLSPFPVLFFCLLFCLSA